MPDCFAPRPSSCTGMLTILPLPGRAGLMIAGEADITTQDALRAALAALAADGTGDIYLDLTGLRFIDLSCTRELIAITGRHPGVRLIVYDPPACLLRIIALVYPQADITFIAGPVRTPEPPAAPARTQTWPVPAVPAAPGRTGDRPAAAGRRDDARCLRPGHR
jgi:anti-anti-sigma regulatory factor